MSETLTSEEQTLEPSFSHLHKECYSLLLHYCVTLSDPGFVVGCLSDPSNCCKDNKNSFLNVDCKPG